MVYGGEQLKQMYLLLQSQLKEAEDKNKNLSNLLSDVSKDSWCSYAKELESHLATMKDALLSIKSVANGAGVDTGDYRLAKMAEEALNSIASMKPEGRRI